MRKMMYILLMVLLLEIGATVLFAASRQTEATTQQPTPTNTSPIPLSEIERLRGQNVVLQLQALQNQANTLLGSLGSLTTDAMRARKLDPNHFRIDWESCFVGSSTPSNCGQILEVKTDDETGESLD